MRGSLTIVVVVTAGLLLSSRGSAQSEPQLPPQYLAIKLGLALAGSVHAHVDGRMLKAGEEDMPVSLATIDRDSALEIPGPFVEIEYLFSAYRMLALGPLLGFHSWRSTAAASAHEDPSFGVDLGFIIQPRLPLGRRFELYLSIPLSLTLGVLNEYRTWTQ